LVVASAIIMVPLTTLMPNPTHKERGRARFVNASRLIVTYLAEERSMRRSSPDRLYYLRNRVDDCRLLREKDVVVRAWRWSVTFATAKKLPALVAGTAAILLRRIAEARNGPRQIY
jgi:hypothetical protein